MLRWLLATLLLAALTACSSTSTATVPTSTVRPTNLPAATVTTQPATPAVTGGINLSSLTGRIVFSAGRREGAEVRLRLLRIVTFSTAWYVTL